MKKNYALFIIALLCGLTTTYAQMSDLIISEYCEGSSNNKYIEIYNGTGVAVDLSDYEVWRVANGGTWAENTLALSGTLADGDTYVIANPSANATILAAADLTDGIMAHNGDDPVGLAYLGTLIDAVGTDGPDPGTGWDVAGVTNGTLNRTLVRKDNICSPNTNWTTSAGTNATDSEWIVSAAIDDFSDMGSHTEFCSSTDTFVEFVSTTSTVVEGGVSIDVCLSITNFSATNATTVDITLDGASTATNGDDYDDGSSAAISFPQTVIFPANSSTNECYTIYLSNDDLIYEGDETVVLNLSNPTGGTNASLGGNTQHTLTITDNETPVIPDVVITEIMYNTPGNDDEWIEICNTSGLPQVLNDCTVEVDGTVWYTFPSSGAIIPDGECRTISIGDYTADGVYNTDCPFTADYGSPTGINRMPNFPSAAGIDIEIIASDGSTTIDIANYDDADGGNGNGASLHVIDDSLDNSDTGTNWQEVIDGGSPGFNSLISQCSSLQPEINVEGDINTYPNITNGDTTPSFFDNTMFSNINIGGSETKSFRIQNIGTADLTVSNIEIIGVNAGDFSLTLPSALPIVVSDISTMTNVEVFDVTFMPSAVGNRDATVRITNDDPTDGENIFEFAIRGVGICTTGSNTLTPLTGPDNTVVTIIGTDLDGSTTVEFAGSVIAHTSISTTEIEITIPIGASTGSIVVTNNIGCQTSDLFTVIDTAISSCEGSSGLSPTDLFISEVTDAPTGSHTYIEIFNGTGAAINLADYEIRIHNNGANNAGGDICDLTGVIADGSTYVIGIGGSDATDPEGGFTADDFFSVSGINDNDNIRLYFDDGVTETWLDVWGDTAGSSFTIASAGYTYRRRNTGITVPRVASWGAPDNMQNDWIAVSPVDYSNIGIFDFSTGLPPTITMEPSDVSSTCDLTASLMVTATEGFSGSLPLAYQWYVSAPGDSGWTQLSNDATYSGVTNTTLNISNTIGLDGYQYYCQVRENSATCYSASDAVRLNVQSTVWEATNTWSRGAPDLSTIAVIDANYDTATYGSFDACKLYVNTGSTLTINDNTYVRVDTDLTVDGNILVSSYGSFVQIDDAGIVAGDVLTTRNKITVEKTTGILNSWLEYTYWSSPVSGETVGNGLNESFAYRRFLFNAQNYRDSFAEVMNDNATNVGQDDVDDDGNDWQLLNSTDVMTPGIGYAATHSNAGFIGPGNQYTYTFEGPFNNGIYSVPVYRNDAETNDNNWNFIGNPYPSAISADTFFSNNVYNMTTNPTGVLEGAIYLWSHNTSAQGNVNGNEAYNFSQSDYAIINGTGEIPASDGIPPGRYVSSGQGFFVAMSDDFAGVTSVSTDVNSGNVVFNNNMRDLGNNSQFFRNSSAPQINRLKINLTSDNGIFNQILVGYITGATNSYDGMYYDAPRNLSTGANSVIYSIIDGSDKRLAIQGKSPSSLSLDEVIPLGFYTSITEATIYKLSIAELEGDFLTNNTVYVRDLFENTIHNLSQSDYAFASETGEFTDRFEIVFQPDTLSTIENELGSNGLSIVELQNGNVKFSVSNGQLTIKTVEIFDMLGRSLYQLKGDSSQEVYELDLLSQSAYIAKVTLSNGQSITKRAIKRH
ncbi:lamin tail domain-containing protein [Psychroserpens sp. XS_ASV72]|uniref:lamin tail domain-containing protein n=1 Tax=Psychroserpens sp. XS_ASV72 TaxID=3241293 RepID=UPI003517A7E8